MNRMFLGAGAISAVSPVLMGAAGVDVPQGAPEWLPWALVVVGPAVSALGLFAVKAAIATARALASRFRKDKDKSNDTAADVLDSLADGAEVALKSKEKK